MATLRCTVAIPTRELFSGEIHYASVPGAEGGYGVLPGHEMLVSADKQGVLTLWLDEAGNEIELKDDEDDGNYQPGRFRDDDYERYQDVGSESEFADAGFTMKETSDDDDFAVGADTAAEEDDYLDGED